MADGVTARDDLGNLAGQRPPAAQGPGAGPGRVRAFFGVLTGTPEKPHGLGSKKGSKRKLARRRKRHSLGGADHGGAQRNESHFWAMPPARRRSADPTTAPVADAVGRMRSWRPAVRNATVIAEGLKRRRIEDHLSPRPRTPHVGAGCWVCKIRWGIVERTLSWVGGGGGAVLCSKSCYDKL